MARRLRMTDRAWLDRLRAEPAAAAALAVFVLSARDARSAPGISSTCVGLPPCPLCLEERIALSRRHPAFAVDGDRGAGARAARSCSPSACSPSSIAALCNAVLGAYHAGVEWHLVGRADRLHRAADRSHAGGSLLSQLQSIHVVRCDEAAWRFLGISLAGYNVLISLVLAAIAGFGLVGAQAGAKRRQAGEGPLVRRAECFD